MDHRRGRGLAALGVVVILGVGACSGSGTVNGAKVRSSIYTATAGIGRPGATGLAVTAFGSYGQAVHADPGNHALAGLQSPMAHLLIANYDAVSTTVAYGAAPSHQGGPTCTTPISAPPAGTDPAAIGDLRALAYAIGGIAKDTTAYGALESMAFAAARGSPGRPPEVPSVEALGFILNSGPDADHGPDAVRFGQFQIGVLNRWIDTTFPTGPYGSPQDQANLEVTDTAARGAGQADRCFNRTLDKTLSPSP